MKFKEENGLYELDCTKALWATDEIRAVYDASGAPLSDTDFVVETEDFIYLIEYKNGNIQKAIEHGQVFNPAEDKKRRDIIKNFYDSRHYLTIKGKNKPVKYIYIVEYPDASVTTRKMLRNNIVKQLPFKLQKNQPVKLIYDFAVVSIAEWNEHEEYARFPLKLIT